MAQEYIRIVGARENNLKNVSLDIPKRKVTIFTGVSGSGKSSIVFDTLAQEAGRQLNETFRNIVRMFLPRYNQPDADAIENLPTAIVVDQKRLGGTSRSTLGTITDINTFLRLLFSRFAQPHIGYANAFSFNDPAGMCKTCEGIGKIVTLDVTKALDMDKSLNEGAILLPGYNVGNWLWKMYAGLGLFDNDKKLRDFTPEEFDKLVYAAPEKLPMQFLDGEMNTTYEGLVERFIRQNIRTEREKSEANQKKIEAFTTVCACPDCGGKRLNARALTPTLAGYTIHDFTEMPLDQLIATLKTLDSHPQPIVQSIMIRLQNLIDIGLDYVTLSRETATLSGGESQRVKMVKHLSSALCDVMYIFDEPSIGLHARDVHRLNELLEKLRDKGNTVIVVEHDPDVIRIADHIVDVGPKAGAKGGKVVYQGDYPGLLGADTLTGHCLGQSLPIKASPRPVREFYESSRSNLHNLQDVSLRVPKGVLTVVTGVAGSGKSTLVGEVFAKDFPEAIRIDQNALSVNSRSNPATFIGCMDAIRQLFAKENGVSAGLFSANSEGACPVCNGSGLLELNLSYMDTMETPCEECGGKRFRPEALMHRYKGKNIVEVLAMTSQDAAEFFDDKEIKRKLESLVTAGLHYMTLGQPMSTLSGGECQRLKLAKELNKKGNLYILDEPTTGLHISDVAHMLGILDSLVQKGNTVLVIEHNLDVIRSADWVIDLGPDGGRNGGHILYEGPVVQLQACAASVTAKYL